MFLQRMIRCKPFTIKRLVGTKCLDDVHARRASGGQQRGHHSRRTEQRRRGQNWDALTMEGKESLEQVATKIARILTGVLIAVSAIALIISGIGIMNIMLVTVTERTREIGLRMAVGAARRDVLEQFLVEAVLISITGGLAGTLIGVAIPVSVQYFTDDVSIPISPLSILIAFSVSLLVGLLFGILPANRAARLNPTEALRYE